MAIPTIDPSASLKTVSLNQCSGQHKPRLLIGEGNFSFALALINKHDSLTSHNPDKSLAHSIVATELKEEIHCSDCDLMDLFSDLEVSPTQNDAPEKPELCNKCIETTLRIDELEKKGVKVKLGIDGRKLHKIEEFKQKKFKRIHWNCPHDGEDIKNQTLPPIILAFFKSCRKMQEPNDRVHITLAQPPGKKGFYQGYVYGIAHAATLSGYVLVKKRKFDQDRYPGYEHVMTGTNKTATVTEEGSREFVFKKIDRESFKNARKAVEKKFKKLLLKPLIKQMMQFSENKFSCIYKASYQTPGHYFVCSSDEDSSDYEL